MRYVIVVEAAGTGFSAYSPDVPGCVATGPTREAVEGEMTAAIRFHLDGLEEMGEPIPEPRASTAVIDVPA